MFNGELRSYHRGVDLRGAEGTPIKAVADGKADGYTLLTGQVSLMAVNPTLYAAPGFDPIKNFVPITQVNAAPLAIVVASGSPLKSFADLQARSKSEPGKITYATPGNGTLSHLVGVVLSKENGVPMTHVPYKGAGPAINDLLGQQVDVLITSTSSVAGMIQGGQMRALAVTSPRRIGVFGKVPTLEELGLHNARFEDWYGFFAPAGTRNMFVNREPRFYVNICFNGAYWIGDQKTRIQLYYTGGSGKKGTWDYPRSGYIAIKNVSPSSNPLNNNYIKRPFLMMRYAEMLLNYVEALNEYDPGNPDIEKYLNLIRERGGLGPVQSGLSQELMREQIRLERRIELCFEQLRYFDTRRWLIAEQTDGGPFYGMNVDAGNSFTDEAFYEKTVFETRVFRPEFYLFPIPQSEINRDPQIVQNPGW